MWWTKAAGAAAVLGLLADRTSAAVTVINLPEDLGTLSYELLQDDKVAISLVYEAANGWVGFVLNPNPGMSGGVGVTGGRGSETGEVELTGVNVVKNYQGASTIQDESFAANGKLRLSFTASSIAGRNFLLDGTERVVIVHGTDSTNNAGHFKQLVLTNVAWASTEPNTPSDPPSSSAGALPTSSPTSAPTEKPKPVRGTQTVLGGKGTITFVTDPENDAVDLELTYKASAGWLSIGFSETGLMVGSPCVIGLDAQANPSLPGAVAEYLLESKQVSGAKPLSVSSISEPSFTKEGGMLKLAFRATAIGQVPIDLTNGNRIILAYGSSDSLDTHDVRESSALAFSGLAVLDDEVDGISVRTGILAHGSLMVGALLYLMPIGAIPSVLRLKIGSAWFPLHRGLQMFAVAATLVGGALAMAVQETHFDTLHKQLGLFVLIIALLQPVFAVFLRHVEGKRAIWFGSHLLFAAILVGLGAYVAFLGLDISRGLLGESTHSRLQGAFYGGVAITVVVVVVVPIHRLMMSKPEPEASAIASSSGKGGPVDHDLII